MDALAAYLNIEPESLKALMAIAATVCMGCALGSLGLLNAKWFEDDL